MMRYLTPFTRAAALAWLVLLVPACGDRGRGSAPLPPQAAPDGNVALSTTCGMWACLIPDTEGGAFAFWFSPEGGARGKVMAQRLGPLGTPLWNSGGIPLTSEPTATALFRPSLAAVPDGRGGAIVAWSDSRAEANRSSAAYVQRIDASGRMLWESDEIRRVLRPAPQS